MNANETPGMRGATVSAIWAYCLLALVASGCGVADEFAPVEGTLRIAGAPAANILVTFTPVSAGGGALPRSVAVTDDEGYFLLRTDQGQQGAIVARHRVTVEDMNPYAIERTDKPPSANDRPPAPRVPPEYSTAATTPLSADVTAGGASVELEVPAAHR